MPTAEYVVTAAVVLGTAAAVGLLGSGRRPRRVVVAALVAGTVAVVAPAFTGHTRAATPEALVVGADMLHLLAGSIWLGGLVGLALTLRDLADRGDVGAVVLARFSGLAAGVVVALVVAGSVLAWRIVGSWDALVSTGYGRLLLVKVAFALVAVAIAAWNRYRLLPALRASTRQRTRRAGADLLRARPGGGGVRARRGARDHRVPGRPEPAGGGVGGRPGTEQRADRDARRRRPAGPAHAR